MGKIERSWTLFKRSMEVVGSNKTLLLFPIIVFILTCIIGLFFLVPMALWDTGHAYTDAAHWKSLAEPWVALGEGADDLYISPSAYALLAFVYLFSMFLATFLNVAFYNEIFNALNGRPVSVLGGLRFATTRLRPILLWSLFSGLVGLAIKALEQRAGFVGRWVVKFIGLAWSVASVFVVPAIVRGEKHANPVHFLRASASALRRTWGESLTGYLGIRFGQMTVLAMSVALIALSGYVSFKLGNFWILGVVAAVCVTILALVTFLLSVASRVYLVALYIYASEGVVPAGFNQEQMDMAWRIKAGRKPRSK
jgi:hypothetical protein